MNLTTKSHKLFVVRPQAVVSTAFSAALANGGDYASKPTSGVVDILDTGLLDVEVERPDPKVIADSVVNGLSFSFAGGDAADETFSWKLFAWRNENGCAKLAAEGTGILGTQEVVKWPHTGVATTNIAGTAADRFWADTIVVTNEYWYKEVESTGVGGDSVNEVWLDCGGYRYFFMEITAQDGADMAVFGGYW